MWHKNTNFVIKFPNSSLRCTRKGCLGEAYQTPKSNGEENWILKAGRLTIIESDQTTSDMAPKSWVCNRYEKLLFFPTNPKITSTSHVCGVGYHCQPLQKRCGDMMILFSCRASMICFVVEHYILIVLLNRRMNSLQPFNYRVVLTNELGS